MYELGIHFSISVLEVINSFLYVAKLVDDNNEDS